MKFIGIDAGNSACKIAYYEGERIVYGYIPNVTGEAIKLDIPPTGPDEKLLAVEVLSAEEPDQTKQYFIGELARQQLQEYACQDRNRNKVESEAVNLIVPAVLGMFGSEQIVLGVGATLQDYGDQAPQLAKKLTKRHEVKFNLGSRAGQVVKPEVMKTYTFAQGAAGLLSMLKSDTGRINYPEWAEQKVLTLDFGHGQINVALMDRLQFVKKLCFSKDYGFYRVAAAVQDFLNAKPYYYTATIPQLQSYVEKGYFAWRGEKIDLSEIIGEQCAKLADMILAEVNNRLAISTVDSLVIMGGGGEIMAPFVGSRFGIKPIIAGNGLYANAKGLLLTAKEKWEKEYGKIETQKHFTLYGRTDGIR